MRDLTEIVMAVLSIAVLALLIGRSRDTATVIRAGTSGLNDVLRTVTLQNSLGGVAGGMQF